MESFGIRREISRCHSWQRPHIIFPKSSACHLKWISMGDCILPMHSSAEVLIWSHSFAFPALSCCPVLLCIWCISYPTPLARSAKIHELNWLVSFTKGLGYCWQNPASLSQRTKPKFQRSYLRWHRWGTQPSPAEWEPGASLSLSQVALFKGD